MALYEFLFVSPDGSTSKSRVECKTHDEAVYIKEDALRHGHIFGVYYNQITPDRLKIEDIAWKLYQNGIKVKWTNTPLKREEFYQYEDYDMWMLSADQLNFETLKHKYPVIQVPASGKSVWYGGARAMFFVYSKDHGNFILEGYNKEVEEYLKKNYTHYFYRYTYWCKGISRGGWKFWKDTVGILEPSKAQKTWKYTIRLWTGGRNGITVKESDKRAIQLKRLPKRWIPEFNKF